MALIPILLRAAEQPVALSLGCQLQHCRASYEAVPNEHNRYQVVRLERLLREISS